MIISTHGGEPPQVFQCLLDNDPTILEVNHHDLTIQSPWPPVTVEAQSESALVADRCGWCGQTHGRDGLRHPQDEPVAGRDGGGDLGDRLGKFSGSYYWKVVISKKNLS